jgi:MFS family permease
LSWIANLFTIVAPLRCSAGVLADRIGRRKMLLIGVAMFTAGSLLGALAPNPSTIMAARVIQALGASAYTPAAAAVLISAFPAERLAMAIGVWAVTGGVSSALGPSLGGLVVGWGGWRWAFWLNIPVGLLVLIFGPHYLPDTKGDRSRAIPDPFGALLTILGISAITLVGRTRTTTVGAGCTPTLPPYRFHLAGSSCRGATPIRCSTRSSASRTRLAGRAVLDRTSGSRQLGSSSSR